MNADACNLCGNPEREIYAKNKKLCRSCYRLESSIDQIKLKMDRSISSSQRLWFKCELEPKEREREERVRFRQIYWQRKYPVGGHDLEVLLTKIAKRLLIKKNQDPFGGSATAFNHEFSAGQRWLLYRILSRLDDPMRLKTGFK